ncbi:carbon-nitrogen hydrolase family protein [Rhodococcus sp. NCIMB 12038]|uniref:carbon-nitrogen hydrolase family protein n=1 Tax=Rhodococcus sp. NCIMB 12038 TaxID=933800 RepID=UPI000B3CDA0A|nr:carbon-nitrogen hydrolase family protein [Rhodococcus sp. NCIMB 12038]OUS91468.1 carbon-nitrogen hydrolase [Rhodococcus sp. NCIMB 12038]
MRAALFQGPELSSDVAPNLAAVASAAQTAAAAGASILVCPEMSATGYNIGPLIAQRAEPADGPIAARIAEIARASGITVVYGYPEADGDVVYNSVQALDPSGNSLANYRKTHLFGDLDRAHFAAGGELVVQFDHDGIRCGLLICYDVEFPEAVRAHADRGTQWLIVPTGLMSPYEFIAESVVPTRAYESQVFVTYVNRCGTETDLDYCGSSCAIAPDGTELARAGRHEELAIVDFELDVLHRSRRDNTHLDDRRVDLYPFVQEKTS